MKRSEYYPDVIIFLILIPFISAFNYYLTYTNIEWGTFLFITYTIDTVEGYLVWWVVRKMILYYDRVYPLEGQEGKRILLQFTSTTIVGVAILGILTELVSQLVRGHSAPAHFFSRDLVIISIWFFVINSIYLGLYYYHKLSSFEETTSSEAAKGNLRFLTKKGNRTISIAIEELDLFRVDEDYVTAFTRDGSKYLLEQSLTEIGQLVPKKEFFRLNRQCIARKKIIREIRKIENGKLNVQCQVEGIPLMEFVISRTKAPGFKKWWLA